MAEDNGNTIEGPAKKPEIVITIDGTSSETAKTQMGGSWSKANLNNVEEAHTEVQGNTGGDKVPALGGPSAVQEAVGILLNTRSTGRVNPGAA